MHSSSSEQTTTAKLSINFLLNQGNTPSAPPLGTSPKVSSTIFSRQLSTSLLERSPTRKRKWENEASDSFSSTPHKESILPPAPKNYQTLFSRRTISTTTTTTTNRSTSWTRKKRPKYRRYPQETLDKLVEAFNSNPRPSEEDRAVLGGQLGLSPYQVKIWCVFKSSPAKWHRSNFIGPSFKQVQELQKTQISDADCAIKKSKVFTFLFQRFQNRRRRTREAQVQKQQDLGTEFKVKRKKPLRPRSSSEVVFHQVDATTARQYYTPKERLSLDPPSNNSANKDE